MGKGVLFCVGSKEEKNELRGFIADLARAGHYVFVLVEGTEPFAMDGIGVVHTDTGHPDLTRVNFHLIVVGQQSRRGMSLVQERASVPFRVLYQGRYHDASTWTPLHESLTHVWGYDGRCVAGWDLLEHNPYVCDGDRDDLNFYDLLIELLKDD